MQKHAAQITPASLSTFRAAVDAASPALCVPPNLPGPPKGRTIVVGAGKASAAMAKAVEDHWPGPLEGLVITRYGHSVPCRYIEVVEASHPVPDAAGYQAGRRILSLVADLTQDDLVLCLISGGGSSRMTVPIEGVTLDEKQLVNRALLKSGAAISEMNCVRRHLSAIKGGRLAAACYPAPVVALLISDVPGDDPSIIASGPTVADPTSCADALAIIQRYGIEALPAVIEVLVSGRGETMKPGDPRLSRSDIRMIVTPQIALEQAAEVARGQGVRSHILSDRMEGEARAIAQVLAGMALQVAQYGQPFEAPCLLLSGGETTVTVRGSGRGGRNTEFLLALGMALGGHQRIHALACDTDGIDGTDDVAGAYLAPDSLARGRSWHQSAGGPPEKR